MTLHASILNAREQHLCGFYCTVGAQFGFWLLVDHARGSYTGASKYC